jgi:2-polyprenyl-3-methyl-5-hydroxy-6-metoxy-1,4-benzoquinol methylase
MQTETINCPICNRRELDPYLKKDGWSIVKCPSCTLAMVNPRRANTVEIYQDDAYFHDDHYYYDYAGNKAAYQKGFRSKLKLIAQFVPQGGKLLDVGAAYGFLMEEAARFGFVPFGVELSPNAARYASMYGTVFTGTLDAVVTDDRFSAITFIDSLEHFEDPVAGLKKAASLLAPGGVVAVMVPNIDSRFARLMGSRWHLLLPEEHLFYFTPKGLTEIMRAAGFEIVHQGTGSYGRSLEELLRVVFRGGKAWSAPLLKRIAFEINLGDLFVVARKSAPGTQMKIDATTQKFSRILHPR